MAARGNAVKAGRAFVELFADDSELQKGLRRAQANLRAFGRNITQIGTAFVGIGTSIVAPLTAAGLTFAKLGDELDKMSARTNVGVESLSLLGFAAEQSGSSLGEVGNALFRMQRRIANAAQGTGPAVRALEMLGVEADKLSQMNPERQFETIADRLNELGDETLAAQFAFEIFGDSAKGLMPLLKQGAEGIRALKEEGREVGAEISEEAAAAAAEFSDELNKMRKALRANVLAIGSAVLPLMQEWVQTAMDAAKSIRPWIENNQDLLRSLLRVGGYLVVFGGTLIITGKIVAGLVVAMKALGVALTFIAAHPVIAAFAGMALAATALGIALRQVNIDLSKMNDEAKRAIEQGNAMRRQDMDRIRRLEELASKQSLTAAEMKEAAGIVADLEDRYGDLGITLNETTGEFEGLADGIDRATDAMIRQERAQIDAAMREAQRNIDELNLQIRGKIEEQETLAGRIFTALGKDWKSLQREIVILEQNKLKFMDQQLALQQQLNNLAEQGRDAIGGGEAGTAGTGTRGLIDSAKEKALEDELARWRRRLRQLEADEERDRIDERYRHELEQAGATAEEIDALTKRSMDELNRLAEQAETNRSRIAIAIAKARLIELERLERDHQERIAQANQRRSETIEELRIRTTVQDEAEQRRQLLDLERQRAIEEAKRNGENLDLVREEFRLRRQMLDDQLAAVRELESARRHTFGSFATFGDRFAAQQISTVAATVTTRDQADEQTARNTAELVRHAQVAADELRRLVDVARSPGGGLTFT